MGGPAGEASGAPGVHFIRELVGITQIDLDLVGLMQVALQAQRGWGRLVAC